MVQESNNLGLEQGGGSGGGDWLDGMDIEGTAGGTHW